MRATQLLLEADLGNKIKSDPKTLKLLNLAWRHDSTVPRKIRTQLGPNPSPETVADFWGTEVDRLLAGSDDNWTSDLSREGKFDGWLIRLYISGAIDWEDLTGEAVDRLNKYNVLRNRNILQPMETDLNRFRDLNHLNRTLDKYGREIEKLITAARVEKAKRNAQSLTLIDNDRYHVSVPLNYGACYVFNHQTGHQSTFCTGSSTGMEWFGEYSNDGPLINVLDKKRAHTVNGKWQIHAPSKQINNSDQTINSDNKFSGIFPGLMSEIQKALLAHARELNAGSQDIVKGGWNISRAIEQLKRAFPKSTASVPRDQQPETPAAT
jgi:hypothetical protein